MTEKIYEYAFINSNNVVINVCVFKKEDVDLIDFIKTQLNATLAISCDEFGPACINGTWDGQHFLYEDGSRVPLTHAPEDDNYLYNYDFELEDWVPIAQNRLLDNL